MYGNGVKIVFIRTMVFIDPIYREFSYPYFGFKKNLRGGSWAVPDYLIHPKYRNAQMPETRIQFTGVRVVKDL